jgi:hypothetical protein
VGDNAVSVSAALFEHGLEGRPRIGSEGEFLVAEETRLL